MESYAISEVLTPTPSPSPSSTPSTTEELPLRPQHLLSLFFRPGKFFSAPLALDTSIYVIIMTLCYSVADKISHIENQLAEAEMGNDDLGLAGLQHLFAGSWLPYWGFVLLTGLIGAIFVWWLGGWWYGLRVKWSGAPDVDGREVRIVYVYSGFVEAAPLILATLVKTFFYPDYMAAYHSDELYSLLLLIFPFWAVVVSYIGVSTRFPVIRWKARLWFLILPILLYLVGIVGTIALIMSQL